MKDKEAIERLKRDINTPLAYRNTTIVIIDDLQTVLNLIEKQKEEINYKDEEMFNIVNSDKGKLYKENQELKAMELKAKGGAVRITLEGLIALNNEIKQRDKEIEKKDKIINEMAEVLSVNELDFSVLKKQFKEKYCEFMNRDEDCCWKTDKKCSDCIKEYFENKVKESK